jgi:cell wall-associated NlpC family hydrolase
MITQMPKILAITEAMHGNAKNILAKAGEIQASHGEIARIAGGMTPYFSGALPELLTQRLLDMKKKHDALYEKVSQYSEKVNYAADNYDWSDQEIAGWAEQLGVGAATLAGGAAAGGAISGGETFAERGDGRIQNDPNYYKNKYNDQMYYDNYYKENRYLKSNCKEFARRVIQDTYGINLPSTAGSNYELGASGALNQMGQVVYQGEAFTADYIKNQLFGNAKNGDVVQMSWTNGGYTGQHTAVIAGFTENGVLFLQANAPANTIGIREYSYEELATAYSQPPYADKYDEKKMKSHGATVYHVNES